MLDHDALALARDVLDALRARKMMVVTAESCTGGLVAASLTHHAGSSDVVCGGFVTYSNALKQALLGVPRMTLDSFGAVSEPTARAMSEGALRAAEDAHVGVSITGIAGPGGGSDDKPVGLVWFGLSRRTGHKAETWTSSRVFAGTREQVRAQAVTYALGQILSAAHENASTASA